MFNIFRKKNIYRKDALQVGLSRIATTHYSKTETGERLHMSLDDGSDLFLPTTEVMKLRKLIK